jgi:FkbM family methyltransferase
MQSDSKTLLNTLWPPAMSDSTGYIAWKQGLVEQIDFFSQSTPAARDESSFYWQIVARRHRHPSLRQLARSGIDRLRGRRRNEQWFASHSDRLWETRALLEDHGSQISFDALILLKEVGHQRYFFPNTVHRGDYLEVLDSRPFRSTELPEHYLSLELRTYSLRVWTGTGPKVIQVVAAEGWEQVQKHYSQYLVRFAQTDFFPKIGETVFDCGSCIGETSMLFGAMVGPSGAVHLFDPVPLHIRYCSLQAAINPELRAVFRPVQLAVSDCSSSQTGSTSDATIVSPGGMMVDHFSTVSLDEYVAQNAIDRVDFIKMDIEGSECPALIGASEILKKHKPRLAISAYHKSDDLWVIPQLIRSINPSYRFHFAHHSPLTWESVLYAC